MPSGPKILSRKYVLERLAAERLDETPVHSMLMPYSQRAPGSNTSGWRRDATLPVARLGIPVALM